MKPTWLRLSLALTTLVLAVVVDISHRAIPRASAQNPKCQACKDQALRTYKQRLISACTNTGGVPDVQNGDCDKSKNLPRYRTLVQECSKAYKDSVSRCPCR